VSNSLQMAPLLCDVITMTIFPRQRSFIVADTRPLSWMAPFYVFCISILIGCDKNSSPKMLGITMDNIDGATCSKSMKLYSSRSKHMPSAWEAWALTCENEQWPSIQWHHNCQLNNWCHDRACKWNIMSQSNRVQLLGMVPKLAWLAWAYRTIFAQLSNMAYIFI